jgi:hypothetical protein
MFSVSARGVSHALEAVRDAVVAAKALGERDRSQSGLADTSEETV